MDPPKGGLGGWVPPGAGGVWGGSFPPGVNASPWPSNPSGGIDTYRPGRPVTEPATAGASPALFSASMAAGASDGETTTQKPVPMLKVANIVTAGTRPASAISAKTGGAGGSASSSYDTSAASRARLSRPPPEMCTRPRGVTPASHSASAARTYTRVGASRASSSRWPVPGTRSARASPAISNSARRASEYPLLCRPELGRARMTSPSLTCEPSTGARPGGSAPTAVPTRSSMGGPPAEGASMAPIWAISPPGMAIPASSAPRYRPRATSSRTSASIRSVAR